MNEFKIGHRKIAPENPPFIIAEVGINHDGSLDKAIQCVDSAVNAGADCVKFQCHITEAEMIPNKIVPENAKEPLWDIIKRCELTDEEERRVKSYCEEKNIIYLCTPFSREAADRLQTMDVLAFKIGSGECNNIPLLEHISKFGKPIILSTGMNDLGSIKQSVEAIQKNSCSLMLMHCTSMYPTPYDKVRLGAIPELIQEFGLPVGLSDHSIGIYTCLGAVALGACALEKHFTQSHHWPGPDIPISIDPDELEELAKGSKAVYSALNGHKTVLPEEQPVKEFAFASVVSIKDIRKGDVLSVDNIWVKRPGTGKIGVQEFYSILGKTAKEDIDKDLQLSRDLING
jgi:sialic acid synthase SpsE